MKNIINCLFFCLFSSIATAQTYEIYLNRISVAEMLITQNKFKEAIDAYDVAFANWKTPFALDYYNAMLCATYTNDYVHLKKMAEQLVLLGCNLDFFEKQNKLIPFRCRKEYLDFVKEYSDLRNRFEKKCNKKLRAKIEEMNARDQYWRVQDRNYKIMPEKTYHEDDLIMQGVLPMFRKNYPNEYEVGVWVEQDTVLSNLDGLFIIILHNYQDLGAERYLAKRLAFDVTKKLRNLLSTGKIHPQMFAYLNDRSGKFKEGKGWYQESAIWEIEGRNYFENLSAIESEVNINRKQINLCTLEDDRAKAKFQFIDRPYLGFKFFKCIGGKTRLGNVKMPKGMLEKGFVEIK